MDKAAPAPDKPLYCFAECTESSLLGAEFFLLGTDSLLLGTDSVLLGTDSVLPGTDSLLPGTDSLLLGTDSVLLVRKMPVRISIPDKLPEKPNHI